MFDTEAEAEYTRQLCRAASQFIAEGLKARGFHVPPPTFNDNEQGMLSIKRRRLAATNRLFRRGRGLPAVISEFREVLSLPVPNNVHQVGQKFHHHLSKMPLNMVLFSVLWKEIGKTEQSNML